MQCQRVLYVRRTPEIHGLSPLAIGRARWADNGRFSIFWDDTNSFSCKQKMNKGIKAIKASADETLRYAYKKKETRRPLYRDPVES